MNKHILALTAVMVLSDCLNHNAKEAVKDKPIDPESAKFDRLDWAGGGKYTCGFVNSKTRIGGYTGWTAFVYDGQNAELVNGVESRGRRLFFDNCGSEQVSRYLEIYIQENTP